MLQPPEDFSAPLVFKASADSPLARTRKWTWLGLTLGAVLAYLRGFPPSWAVGSVLLFAGLVELVLRSQLQPGQALVTLTTEGIASPRFSGKTKQYRWSHVYGVSTAMAGKTPVLQLQLHVAPGMVDQRSVWGYGDPHRPSFTLAPFSDEDRQRLFAAVQQRLLHVAPDAQAVDPLQDERDFHRQFTALAPHTWVTYALVLANVLVWALGVAAGVDPLKPSAEVMLHWGGNAASAVQQGEWWRLWTAGFLHSGVAHLATNMLGLWIIGQTVERIYGHKVFALVYAASLLLGSACSLHYSAQRGVSVGASGAVFGIAGALLVAVFQHRKNLPRIFGKQMLGGIGFFVLYSLVQGFAHTGTDNAAHVGGLVAGTLMGLVLPTRFDPPRFARLILLRGLLATGLALLLGGAAVGLAPPAAVDLQRAYVGGPAFDRSMRAFDAAYRALGTDVQLVKAGKLTAVALDERGRTVHAAAFRRVQAELASAWLPPEDKRNGVLRELRTFTGLLVESLAMPSVLREGRSEPEPADPARMKLLEVELQKSSARLPALVAQLPRKTP